MQSFVQGGTTFQVIFNSSSVRFSISISIFVCLSVCPLIQEAGFKLDTGRDGQVVVVPVGLRLGRGAGGGGASAGAGGGVFGNLSDLSRPVGARTRNLPMDWAPVEEKESEEEAPEGQKRAATDFDRVESGMTEESIVSIV